MCITNDFIWIRSALDELKEKESNLDKIRGSLFGGAIGDALGYPVKHLNESEIMNRYGSYGITSYDIDTKTGKALVTDNTQLTLFTANGMLVGETRLKLRGIGGVPHHYIPSSFNDWLWTRNVTIPEFQEKRNSDDYCNS